MSKLAPCVSSPDHEKPVSKANKAQSRLSSLREGMRNDDLDVLMSIPKRRNKMNEAEIRMDAQKYGLVASMFAINAIVQGMIAENNQRQALGQSMAYQYESFKTEADKLDSLSTQLLQI